jgi:4-amino-4-deoxy-L-arabinose transferase-like glycosyltransferase
MKNLLYGLLILKAVLACVVIFIIGLHFDEAQYWTWSQHLDWGYYSKPPGIAWQIALGCWFFGNTVLGVRFVTIILSGLLSLAIYRLSKICGGSDKVAFWSAIVMAFCPLGILGTLFATTDSGFILFWVLALTELIKNKKNNFVVVGILIGLGALFKWPIYFLWIPTLLVFRTPRVFVGILISLLGLLPSLIWNYQHEWATFKHVLFHNMAVNKTGGNFFEFLGGQLLLLSPFIFGVLVWSFKHLRKVERSWRWCGGLCLLILGMGLVTSMFKKMQANWIVYAYPSGIVFLSYYAVERLGNGILWLKTGIVLSVVIFAVLVGSIYFPLGIQPFKHTQGWERLSSGLQKADYDPEEDFLFSSSYHMASLLSFYGPGQKVAYFFNLDGVRKNQFTYWPGVGSHVGQNGFFVEKQGVGHYIELLRPYFQDIEQIDDSILRCINYNGHEPSEVDRF